MKNQRRKRKSFELTGNTRTAAIIYIDRRFQVSPLFVQFSKEKPFFYSKNEV